MHKFFSVIIVSLVSYGAYAQSWSIKTSFQTESYSSAVQPAVVMNNRGQTLAFISGIFQGSSDVIHKTLLVSQNGKMIAEKSALLPESADIRQLATDKDGNFMVSVMQGIRNDEKNQYPYAAVYVFDSLLNQKFFVSLDSVFFPVGIMVTRKELQISFSTYSTFKLLDKIVPLIKDGGFQLATIDWRAKTVLNLQKIGPGDLLNEPGLFIQNNDGSFYLVQNTVILKGPDHHDTHVYSFDTKGKLIKHKHLKGAGQLTHLWVRFLSVDGTNQLLLQGFSDDAVNFDKADVFFRSDPSGKSDSLEQFGFKVHYNQNLAMKGYGIMAEVSEELAAMFPVFAESGVLSRGIKYRTIQGDPSAAQPVIFEIYKE